MRIKSPSLPELHAFVAAMETGGFTSAADRLSVTQGAISRAVQRLESTLGVTLFERGINGVRATALAQLYYSRVQPALVMLEDAVPDKQAGVSPQILRLSAIPSLNMRWLVPRLNSFHAMHPWCEVVFKTYVKDDDMKREDIDAWVVTRTSSRSRWPRHVRSTYIIGREIVPICHPGIAERIRKPADLLKYPLLHHTGYPGNWALWFESQGVDASGMKLGAGFDLGAGLIEAVAANMGVAVLQLCLFERELADGRVAVPLPLPVSTGRGYYLCVPRSATETSAIAAFRQWILDPARRAPL